MNLQSFESASYIPRSDIIRLLEERIDAFDRLDAELGLAIHRLIFKLRNCRGENAVQPVEAALVDLQRALANDEGSDVVQAIRQKCLELVRTLA